jgi:hypothetical protein
MSKESSPNRKTGSEDDEAVYLYCFARAVLLDAVAGESVNAKSPLFLQRFGQVAAVASRVAMEEFCGPDAESRLRDLSWLGPRACRHEKVIEHVMACSPVLPVRFGTIFSSLKGLDDVLKRHHRVISRFLDRVADKEEWAVKGLLNRAKATEGLVSIMLAADSERLSSLSPGTRYFEERRIRADVETELRGWLKGARKKIASDLSRYASDLCERKVFPGNIEGGEMVLNWAFLVPRSGVADFRARIEQANADYERQGLVFQVSGPWPPYSFCPSLRGRETK